MLISVAIPTYNRAYLLDDFFIRLYTFTKRYHHKIEILVSNNSSTDKTNEICNKWRDKFSDLVSFKYTCQSTNLGVARNITYLLENARGDFFLILPDDDELIEENFSLIVDILESDSKPSAIIQARWDGKNVINKSGYISFNEATRLFYEYGNAWAGIINTSAAQKVLLDQSLRESIESIWWPQTIIGFLAMYDLRDQSIYAFDSEIGRNYIGCQNITNKLYWTKSFHGLLQAATVVDKAIGGKLLRQAFVNFKTRGFIAHLQAIVFSSLVTENTTTIDTRILLRREFGMLGWLTSLLLYISDHFQKILIPIASIAYLLRTGKTPRHFLKLIKDKRSDYLSELKKVKDTNKRFNNWY